MKRVLSAIVASLIALSFSAAVFAADATPSPSGGDTSTSSTEQTKPAKKSKKSKKKKSKKSQKDTGTGGTQESPAPTSGQ